MLRFAFPALLALGACANDYPIQGAYAPGYDEAYELRVFVDEPSKTSVTQAVNPQARHICGGDFEVLRHFKAAPVPSLTGWHTGVIVGCT